MERLSSGWLDRIRAMSVGERLADTLALADLVIAMGRSEVRERYPNADDREVRLRNAARHLSRDLMIRAYGWDPDAHKNDRPPLEPIDCEFSTAETIILAKLRSYRSGGESSERPVE
jgi:hypothetical protein